MGAGDSINSLESILRDLIERVLRQRYGEQWMGHLGITDERRAGWEERREVERKKRTAGTIDERLLYYADFTDLFPIIKKNWAPEFRSCFGDQAELRTYLEKLADLRNPDAHSRSLLEVEEQLVAGMTGELRQKITIFLSEGGGGPEPEHFARIEELVDSFGNRVTGKASGMGEFRPDLVLRPGDRVAFRGQAWDPQGSPVTWKLFFVTQRRYEEHAGHTFEAEWTISDADIAEQSIVVVTLIPARPYFRRPAVRADDEAFLVYRILPSR